MRCGAFWCGVVSMERCFGFCDSGGGGRGDGLCSAW